jgi:hypothetical protein
MAYFFAMSFMFIVISSGMNCDTSRPNESISLTNEDEMAASSGFVIRNIVSISSASS